MSERIQTPPPPVDKSKYLIVVHPYPLNTNLELDTDQRALALWLGCCAGKDILQAMFYRSSSPEMVVIQVDPEFDRFHELLGLHVWSEFLVNPTKEQMDKSSIVFFSTFNADRLAKGGWKRVNIEEHWFHGWSPDNSIIRYPYPKTSQCNVPSSPEANSGAPVCRLLPQGSFPVQSPLPAPPVGSAEWSDAGNSNGSPTPSPIKEGETEAPGDTASVTSANSESTKSLSPPPAQPPSSGTRPRGLDAPDYDPWNPPVDAAVPAGIQSGAAGAVNPWAGYDGPRLEPPTKVKKGEWMCPLHGSLCGPGICKERDRWGEERRQREARKARDQLKRERKKTDATRERIHEWRESVLQVFGNASSSNSNINSNSSNSNSNSNSSSSESDTETLVDQECSSAPSQPDQEEWSVPWSARGTNTPSTMGSAPPTLDPVAGWYDADDDEDEGASVARSRTAGMNGTASPPASVSSRGRSKEPMLSATLWGSAGQRQASSTSARPAAQQLAWDTRSAADQSPSAGGRGESPSLSGSSRDSTDSAASANDSDTGPATRQPTWVARGLASSSARTGAGPSTPSTASNSSDSLTYTQCGDPIAMVLAEMAKEDSRKKGGKGVNVEGGQKMPKSARKWRNKGRNALAQAQAEAQAAQASLLEAMFDVEIPTGGPDSSWGDPNEVW